MMGDTPAERNNEFMSSIKAELEAAPSLEPYEYRAWDSETIDFVNSILSQYLNPGSSMDTIMSPSPSKPTKTKVSTETTQETKTTDTSPTEASDDLDSFLNDLDM